MVMLLSRIKELEEKINYRGWEDRFIGEKISRNIPQRRCLVGI